MLALPIPTASFCRIPFLCLILSNDKINPDGSADKESACKAGDTGDAGSISGSGRSFGVGYGNSLQYSCLKNPIERVAWWVIVHRVAKSQTRLRDYTHAHTHTHTQPLCRVPQVTGTLLTFCECYLESSILETVLPFYRWEN